MQFKTPIAAKPAKTIIRQPVDKEVEESKSQGTADEVKPDGTTDVLEAAVDRAGGDGTYEGTWGIHLQEEPEDKARRIRVAKARGDAQAGSDAKDAEFHEAFESAIDNKITKHDT